MNKERLTLEIAQSLKQNGFQSARFEAKEIVNCVLGECLWNTEVTPEQLERIEKMLERRLKNEPLQYILGEWEFFGLLFKVGQGVLIPRQDTETLVETALPLITPDRNRVFDLCAGSGCIGITLSKLGKADVTLFEKSEDAFEYLEQNISLNGVNVQALQYDVLGKAFDKTADMIVSNPPYIRTEVVKTLEPEVKCEPMMALDGGEDGLIFYRHIANEWKSCLTEGGYLIFEIGFDQGQEVCEILKNAGYKEVKCIKDLGNNDRVVIGRK